MKKRCYILVAAAVMALFALPGSAQLLTFGMEAGGTISHSTAKFDDGRKAKGVGGYTVGVTVEAEIFEKTWLQTGLTFLTKGDRYEVKGLDVEGSAVVKRNDEDTFRPMYVYFPFKVAYKFDLSPRARFFVSGGAFLAQGIGGQYESQRTYNDSRWENGTINRNVFSADALKRFDCGLSAGAGFELGKLVLRVGYDWSLINIAKDREVLNAGDFKNRSIAIALGLKFR